MLLLGIVNGLCCKGMVNANSIVQVVRELILAKAVLILVQVQNQVPERATVHAPTTLTKWRCGMDKQS